MSASELRDEIGGYLGRVSKGLGVNRRQAGDDVSRLLRRYVQLDMVGSQMLCHGLRVWCLVELNFIEADGEGVDTLTALSLHQGHDEGRIDSAGQKRAERNV